MLPASTTKVPDSDRLTRFMLPRAGVRGVRVHLDDTWRQIRERDADTATGTLHRGPRWNAGCLRLRRPCHRTRQGRRQPSVQFAQSLRVRTCSPNARRGTLRGIAQVQAGAPISRDLYAGPERSWYHYRESDREARPVRYQGMVALQADSLGEAFEDYFRQSEQLPTRLLLAVDGRHAAGLMLQKLPDDGGDEDGWPRANALFDTLSPQELLAWPCDLLLQRLFHEDQPALLGERPLAFACSCSRERVAACESLGRESRSRRGRGRGPCRVRCEFAAGFIVSKQLKSTNSSHPTSVQ